MKVVLSILFFVTSLSSFAKGIDLEANMKNMGLAYKNAVQASELSEFNHAIDEFIQLLEKAKTADFKQHQSASIEGIDKVIHKAEDAKRLANKQGILAAKVPLKEIDTLRKKYHELHEPPGFWELLFGK